jgi:molybdopterin-guanine dinucleotide biosynthesis protein A
MSARLDELLFSGVILAGGRSSRMGTDKALLEIDGQQLWRRQYDLLAQAGASEHFVSVRPEQDWLPNAIKRVDDKTADCGPLAGLVAVAEQVNGTHLIVLAVDLPRLPLVWLTRLQAICQSGRGAVGVGSGGRFEPLAAIYPAEIFPLMREALKSGELSLQRLLSSACVAGLMREQAIQESELSWFENWNTPADTAEQRPMRPPNFI